MDADDVKVERSGGAFQFTIKKAFVVTIVGLALSGIAGAVWNERQSLWGGIYDVRYQIQNVAAGTQKSKEVEDAKQTDMTDQLKSMDHKLDLLIERVAPPSLPPSARGNG